MKYNLIICGGTFDLFHLGHKKFLQNALGLSDKVLLGITSDKYISVFKNNSKSSLHQNIENFETRKKAVLQFLNSIGADNKVEIFPIDTPEEPLLENKYNPEAIIVTAQTEKSAQEINKKRKSLGLSLLEIIVFEMEKAEDVGEISSTRIRNGDIDKVGKLFVRPSWKNSILSLPHSLRPQLQAPLGKVLENIPDPHPDRVIAIGDITTQKFNEKELRQQLSIVDFKVKRHTAFNSLNELGFSEAVEENKLDNPPGKIAPELWDGIKRAINSKERNVILINGEDDLAVLPTILVAPLGFFVYYGQPDTGLVELEITLGIKEWTRNLVDKFSS